ncbi:hypothetical protein [Fusobacterium polymorphum]|uniref:hypothetical protein n=1 Tax=Fusobacterium nucleatum subsp. polymorphum TaxID=76857 RepID=UPI0030089BB8
MPLPLLLLAGVAGAASALGLTKNLKYNKKFEDIKKRNDNNIAKYKNQEYLTTSTLNKLTKKNLELDESFKKFQEVFEKIKNCPEFYEIIKKEINLPNFSAEKLKGGATAGLSLLLSSTTGSSIGAAGASAALSSLGGGITLNVITNMLGTAFLSGATLGIGVLVGGIFSSVQGKSLSNKVDEAYSQMLANEKNIDKVCFYLKELDEYLTKFLNSMCKIHDKLTENLRRLIYMISIGKTDYYNDFTHEEQKYLDNATSLTKLLYDMRKVELISSIDNMNIINKTKINEVISYNNEELEKMGNY